MGVSECLVPWRPPPRSSDWKGRRIIVIRENESSTKMKQDRHQHNYIRFTSDDKMKQ